MISIILFCISWCTNDNGFGNDLPSFYAQSTHMASQQITEAAVYLCTGNPMPKYIEEIAFWLLNEPFSTSFKCNLSYVYQYDPSNNSLSNVCFLICLDISDMKMRKGLALVDIIREVTM